LPLPNKPTLRVREEDELILALREQVNLENEVEKAKINLAKMTDFNLFDAFHIFDITKYGFISPNEI
jgi:hypothetical protein